MLGSGTSLRSSARVLGVPACTLAVEDSVSRILGNALSFPSPPDLAFSEERPEEQGSSGRSVVSALDRHGEGKTRGCVKAPVAADTGLFGMTAFPL